MSWHVPAFAVLCLIALWASEMLKPKPPHVKQVYNTENLRKGFQMVHINDQFTNMLSGARSPHLLSRDELLVLNVIQARVTENGVAQMLKPDAGEWIKLSVQSLVACGKLEIHMGNHGRVGYAPAGWVPR